MVGIIIFGILYWNREIVNDASTCVLYSICSLFSPRTHILEPCLCVCAFTFSGCSIEYQTISATILFSRVEDLSTVFHWFILPSVNKRKKALVFTAMLWNMERTFERIFPPLTSTLSSLYLIILDITNR